MRLSEMLAQSRVAIANGHPLDKREAITLLSRLLASGCAVSEGDLDRVLSDREALQSTGIGDGVAIPHAAVPNLEKPVAALLLVPEGLEFGAIDHQKVHHLFAVVGPKREAGEHLRTLARISKLLRSVDFRKKLLDAKDAAGAFALVVSEEEARV